MKNLESVFKVDRYDIKTREKKIIKKYSEIIKNRENLDLRLNETSSKELIKLNKYTLNKIFYLLSDTIPEEHILFLFESSKIENAKNISNRKTSDSIITDNSDVDNLSDERIDTFESDSSPNEKLDSTIDIIDIIKNTNIIKYIKNMDRRKYFNILCFTFLIYGFLTFIHFLRFFNNKEVSITL